MHRSPVISLTLTLLLVSINQTVVASKYAPASSGFSETGIIHQFERGIRKAAFTPGGSTPDSCIQESSCEDTTSLPKMNTCAVNVFKAANKRLNEVYKEVKKQLYSSSEKQLLTDAQELWLKFRKSYCDFAAYAVQGEPGYIFHKYDCLGRVTKQHIKNLEKYMEDLDV